MKRIMLCLALAACGESSSKKTSDGEPADEKSEAVSAENACKKLAKSVGGGECTKGQPGGLGAAAWENYGFELSEPKGKTCQVMSFKKAADLASTEKAYDGAAALAGPHRYGNKDALIFVQCNSGMPRPDGEKLEAALGKL